RTAPTRQVRFGSKADIVTSPRHVGTLEGTSKSGSLSGALARRPLLTRSGLSYCAQQTLSRIGLALAGCLLRALARSSLRRESPFPPCRSYPTRLYRAWRLSRRPFALGHASR